MPTSAELPPEVEESSELHTSASPARLILPLQLDRRVDVGELCVVPLNTE